MQRAVSRPDRPSVSLSRIAAIALLVNVCGTVPNRMAYGQVGIQTGRPSDGLAQVDPRAKRILMEATTAYRALKTYSADIKVTTVGLPATYAFSSQIAVRMPDAASISVKTTTDELKVVTEGHSMSVSSSAQGGIFATRFIRPPESALAEAIAVSGIARFGPTKVLFTDAEPVTRFLSGLSSVSIGRNATIDGVEVAEVVGRLENVHAQITYAFGKKDHLLRQMTVVWAINNRPVTLTETYNAVHANPDLKPSRFAFQPLPGAREVPLPAGANTTPAQTIASAPARSVSGAPGLLIVPAKAIVCSSPNRGAYNFGVRNEMDESTLERTFTLRNGGISPVRIDRVTGSCGCMTNVIRLSNSTTDVAGGSAGRMAPGALTLRPGEEASVDVSIDLSLQPTGAIRKFVCVYAPGQGAPLARFDIEGTLLPAVRFTRNTVDFGTVGVASKRQPVTLSVTVDPRLATKAGVPKLISNNPSVHITAVPPAAGASTSALTQTFAVTLDPMSPLGQVIGFVRLAPDADDSPMKEAALYRGTLPLAGTVEGNFSAEPQIVAFGTVSSGTAVTQHLVIKCKNAASPSQLSTTTNSQWLTVQLGKPSADGNRRSQAIDVRLNPNVPIGLFNADVVVRLAGREYMVIPVSAVIQPARAVN